MLLQASSLALPSNHAAAIEQSPRHKGIKLILADLQPGEHLAAGRMLDEAVGAEVAQAQQPASSIAAVTHADMDAAAVLPDAIEQLALPVHALRKAHHYLGYVRQASERFDVPVGLIMGVIHSESHFNSVAESQKNAQGLMQVVARTGGKEAFALVYKREGKPSIDQLRDPRTNILLGTAYLKKLERVYFKHIRNTEVRLAAVIAAYNAGPTKLRRIFATHGEPETLGQLKRLLSRHAPAETQSYLSKVSKRMKVYNVIHSRGMALAPTNASARANLG